MDRRDDAVSRIADVKMSRDHATCTARTIQKYCHFNKASISHWEVPFRPLNESRKLEVSKSRMATLSRAMRSVIEDLRPVASHIVAVGIPRAWSECVGNICLIDCSPIRCLLGIISTTASQFDGRILHFGKSRRARLHVSDIDMQGTP